MSIYCGLRYKDVKGCAVKKVPPEEVPREEGGHGPGRLPNELVEWHECDDFDMDAAFEAFYRGIDSHEQGVKVWNATLDRSE